MHIDPSISLGNIIAAASVILALWGFHAKNVERWIALKEDIAVIKDRVGTLWNRSGIDDGNGHGQ